MAQRSNRRFLNLISVEVLRDRLSYVGERAGGYHHGPGSLTPLRPNTLAQTKRHSRFLLAILRRTIHIDIRLPGAKTSLFRDAALALQRGGVGYYASSDFIHVDVGRVRSW